MYITTATKVTDSQKKEQQLLDALSAYVLL